MLLTTITALVLTCSAYITTKHLLQQRVYAQLIALVSSKEEIISRRIDADRERTALLSTQSDIRDVLTGRKGSQDLKLLLESMQEEGIPVLGIAVFTSAQTTRAYTGRVVDTPKQDIQATTLVPTRGKEGWDGYTVYSSIDGVGTLSIEYSLREFLLSVFAVPSLGDSGEVLIAKQEDGELILLNHEYAPHQRSTLSLGAFNEQSISRLPIAKAVDSQEGVRMDTNYKGHSVFVAFRQIPALGWGISVGIDTSEAMGGLHYMVVTLLLQVAFFLLIAWYLSMLLARSLAKPIQHLTAKMMQLGPGNWSLGRTIKTGDEVEALERIASEMARRLKRVYDHLEEEVEARTEELKQQYLKDRTILESVESAVIMVNNKGMITDVNPAALEVLKCKGDECKKRSFQDVLDIRLHKKRLTGKLHPVQTALKNRTDVRSTPDKHFSVMRSDNILVPVWLVVKPLLEGKELIGVIIVMHDITEERRVDYLKSEFISLASHQLRTPLSSLQWYIELLIDEKKLDASQEEYVNEMDIAAKRMSNLIDALLHAARLEGGDITPHTDAVDITSLITDVGEELRSMAKEKKITTTIKVPKHKVFLETDSVLLHVVFKNLFSNAVKYTPEGGKVSVTLTDTAKEITLAVKDNGIGIPKKDQKRLFERLFRADNVRKMDTDGNGLGLYITKMIVESLRGTVVAKSTEGKGSEFIVRIPMQKKSAKKKQK